MSMAEQTTEPISVVSSYSPGVITINSTPCTLAPKFVQTTVSQGMGYYTDRTYTFTNVPTQYIGLNMIKTPNDDLNLTNATDYMTFQLQNDSTVYVAYDRRATSLPNWLSGFTDTGDTINTSLSTQQFLKVYRKNYAAGECVNFGANKAPGFSGGTVSNYVVFYSTLSCTLAPKFVQTTVSQGMGYYTDRTYTFTNVPTQYIGLNMIKTPNDDLNLTNATDYMTFQLQNDSTVYVAYDRRATSLPNWLSGFTDTGDTINTSLSTQQFLKVYRKNYAAGECVDFGANKAPGFSGGTVSNYVVFSSINAPPTLLISQPDGIGDTVTAGSTYNITYSLGDPDNVVTAAFFYDTNNTGLDGTPITGACAAAPEGTGVTCSWNTAGMTPGTYYVYGRANDGTNAVVSAYSPGVITINSSTNAPPTLLISQPDGVGDTVTAGSTYNITYSLGDLDNVVTAAFFYDTNNTGLDGTPITGACAAAPEGTGVTCSWNTAGMTPGTYYVYGRETTERIRWSALIRRG